jgi:hypothetical protein
MSFVTRIRTACHFTKDQKIWSGCFGLLNCMALLKGNNLDLARVWWLFIPLGLFWAAVAFLANFAHAAPAKPQPAASRFSRHTQKTLGRIRALVEKHEDKHGENELLEALCEEADDWRDRKAINDERDM